jgi:hypothetical protein
MLYANAMSSSLPSIAKTIKLKYKQRTVCPASDTRALFARAHRETRSANFKFKVLRGCVGAQILHTLSTSRWRREQQCKKQSRNRNREAMIALVVLPPNERASCVYASRLIKWMEGISGEMETKSRRGAKLLLFNLRKKNSRAPEVR